MGKCAERSNAVKLEKTAYEHYIANILDEQFQGAFCGALTTIHVRVANGAKAAPIEPFTNFLLSLLPHRI